MKQTPTPTGIAASASGATGPDGPAHSGRESAGDADEADGVGFATRRERVAFERRQRERPRRPGAREKESSPVSRTTAHGLRRPPLIAVARAERRRRRRAQGGVIFLSMGFAAAMAVATSVPAAAVTSTPGSPELLRPALSASRSGVAQTVLSGDAVADQSTKREDFSVMSQAQLAQLDHMQTADTFTNDPDSPVQWPFPVGVPIASYFGPRAAPIEGASTFHEGVDFDPGLGVDVHAIADGVVQTVHTSASGGLGVYVVIDHVIDGEKIASMYGHMDPGSLRVHVGQHVDVAQVIGQVGDTGISTGPHMHFEILENDVTPVDPYAWLKAHVH